MNTCRPALFVWIVLSLSAACLAQQGDVRRVHDPCIIRHTDTYVLFCTGPGIPIRTSKDLVHWKNAGRVFQEMPAWAQREIPGAKDIWAPDIAFHNGKYHLYYAVSTFGSRDSCIGLATNVTLNPASADYRWEDCGLVLRSHSSDNWNAIDPNFILDEENRPWLAFGSFWSGIYLRRLDVKTGKLSAEDERMYPIARRPRVTAIEAPFIIRRDGWYYLFVSFDHCARGVNSTYRIMVGRSRKLTGPYIDREGKPMLEGGGTEVLATRDRVRGPGHNAILSDGGKDYLVHHFYDARANGIATLQIRPIKWDEQGWPVAGEPLGQ